MESLIKFESNEHGRFQVTNGKGKILDCKFCHKPVWLSYDNRYYDPGGEVFHVENCPLKRAHHSGLSAQTAQNRRDN